MDEASSSKSNLKDSLSKTNAVNIEKNVENKKKKSSNNEAKSKPENEESHVNEIEQSVDDLNKSKIRKKPKPNSKKDDKDANKERLAVNKKDVNTDILDPQVKTNNLNTNVNETNFEEVDANSSIDKTTINKESNNLSESDMTLPIKYNTRKSSKDIAQKAMLKKADKLGTNDIRIVLDNDYNNDKRKSSGNKTRDDLINDVEEQIARMESGSLDRYDEGEVNNYDSSNVVAEEVVEEYDKLEYIETTEIDHTEDVEDTADKAEYNAETSESEEVEKVLKLSRRLRSGKYQDDKINSKRGEGKDLHSTKRNMSNVTVCEESALDDSQKSSLKGNHLIDAIKIKKDASRSGSEEIIQDQADQSEAILPTDQASEDESQHKIIVFLAVSSRHKCVECGKFKLCGFRFKDTDKSSTDYICDTKCVDNLFAANPGKYFLRRKKFLIDEMPADEQEIHKCLQCKNKSKCKYFFRQDDEQYYICTEGCYKSLCANEPDKFNLKRDSIRVRNIGHTTISSSNRSNSTDMRIISRTAAEAESARVDRLASFVRRCEECSNELNFRICGKQLMWQTMDFCDELCLEKYQRRTGSFCKVCDSEVSPQASGKYCVRFGFDIRQFCSAACLNSFKKNLKLCSCCQKNISVSGQGFVAPVGDKEQFKDFCGQSCMQRYDSMCSTKKKLRTDRCAVCNFKKLMRVEITVNGTDLYFCSNPCFSAFKFVSNVVPDQCEMCCKYFERNSSDCYTIYGEKQRMKMFCSRICFNVFIVFNRQITSCHWCKVKKYDFDMIIKVAEQQQIMTCSLNCLALYGVSVNAFSCSSVQCDQCNSYSTPQYHLTMSDGSMRNFCTYQCVMQFQSQFARAPLTLDAEIVASASRHVKQKHSSTKTTRAPVPFPTGLPKRAKLTSNHLRKSEVILSSSNKTPNHQQEQTPVIPVISNVASLATGANETLIGNTTIRRSITRGRGRGKKYIMKKQPSTALPLPSASTSPPLRTRSSTTSPILTPSAQSPTANKMQLRGAKSGKINTTPTTETNITSPPVKSHETKIITVPPYPPLLRNVQTSCQPQTRSVGVNCRCKTVDVGIQTDEDLSSKILLPIPVPIYVPNPMYMYSAPFPVPVPIPLPIPVPIFIPTTRNSANGIMKEIKKIQDKMPSDPYEAELLMIAEMVADEKNESNSDSEEETKPEPHIPDMQYENTAADTKNVVVIDNQNTVATCNEETLPIVPNVNTGEYETPTVDLESAVTANTITHPPPRLVASSPVGNSINLQITPTLEAQRAGRGRKRGALSTGITPRNHRTTPIKRQRLSGEDLVGQRTAPLSSKPVKPDANMCLKYTFGVNAWKQWVMMKNAGMEKSAIRRRPFKTDLLQMTADELNYSLCLFVKEVRKPNGSEYAPDTIYYLVLGIQQYLYQRGRIDNIFADSYYERFTDCLDDVARKFSVLYNDAQYIVTRVEEEHLWECKQLGPHSPHVLLTTLMFFNTKHFNLTTVDDHMQLSFSHIMKHWKRSTQPVKSSTARNVLLRFYPPQTPPGLEDTNPRRKKVYEQQENEINPIRCPVRLYEFYLSKCPESVKTRNDVFYLQPERSCVADSPVWYSTQALSREHLQKILHRVKMVKEINVALLTC